MNVRDFVKDIIFGIEDGLVSILGVVIGVSAGTLNNLIVALAGFSAAIPGALSMAAGDYLSTKSQREVYNNLIDKERKRIRKDKGKVIQEIHELYHKEGSDGEEIQKLLEIAEKNEDILLEMLVRYKYKIVTFKRKAPVKEAFAIFSSYIIASLVPISPFLYISNNTYALYVSLATTIAALFGVGAYKGKYAGRNILKAGLEMLVIGLGAGAVGFMVGEIFKSF